MKRKWRKYLLIPAVLTSGLIISTAKPSMALETSNLRLSAEVDVNNVIDGTPGFDANNDPGNDENAHNDIVRSNDIVTTPIKIVVNTADGSVQNNIKVKIQAIIENNKIGNTSKATFNDPSKTEMDEQTKTVTFTDTYTLTSTGQAISFPINSLANGVDNGSTYRIKYRVTVLDDKGNPTNIVKEFEYDKDITISSRVNIGSALYVPGDSNGIRSEGLIGEEFEGKDAANRTTTINAGVFAQPLPGRKDLKGAAAPTGDITYTFEKSATVAWDGGTRDPLDLTGKDRNAAISLGDAGGYYSDATLYSEQREQNIDVIDGKNGFYAKLGIQDWGYSGTPGFIRTSNGIYNPFSSPSLSTGKNLTYANRTYNVMGSSGKWSTETLDNTTISGTISGYTNNGYPAGSAYQWDRTKATDLVGKRNYISVGNFLMRDVNEYAYGRDQNPHNKNNTLTSTYKLTVTSYKDAQGNTYPLNNSSIVNINYRNLAPGNIIVSGNWNDNTKSTAFTHKDNGDGLWLNYGDGIAPNDSSRSARIVASLRTGSQSIISDGARFIIKWNPQFANIDKDATAHKNAKSNETIPSGYAISKNGKTTYGEQLGFLYQYGVLKDQTKKSDFSYVKNAAYDTDYVWFDDYNTAKQNGEVSAVMFAADMKMTATNAFAGPLMTIHDDNYYTNQQPDGSYNFATWVITQYNL